MEHGTYDGSLESHDFYQRRTQSELGALAAAMAHEINNPLAIIVGKTLQMRGILADQFDDPLAQSQGGNADKLKILLKHCETIESTAMRISRVVAGLRAYARDVENDPFEQAAVAEIIDDTLNLCHSMLRHHDIELRICNAQNEIRITCRPTQVSQIIFNLLNNSVAAVKLQSADKWIQLNVIEHGDLVEISVSDSAPAAPHATQAKMSDPLFSSSGMVSLRIASELTHANGGSLRLDSSAEHRLILQLPKKPNFHGEKRRGELSIQESAPKSRTEPR